MDYKLSIASAIYDTPMLTALFLQAIGNHTDVPYELILINNHPPYMGSDEIIKRWIEDESKNNIHILDFNENIGCHEAINRGFDYAHGEYLCKLDNDTIVPPNWASQMLEAFEKIPELGFLSAYLDKDLQPWKRERKIINGIEIEFCPENMVTLSCAIFTRDAWEKLGPFKSIRDRKYYGGEEDTFYYKSKELEIMNGHYPKVVCKHMARTPLTFPPYGLWKLRYCAGWTNLPFDRWMEESDEGKALLEGRSVENG